MRLSIWLICCYMSCYYFLLLFFTTKYSDCLKTFFTFKHFLFSLKGYSLLFTRTGTSMHTFSVFIYFYTSLVSHFKYPKIEGEKEREQIDRKISDLITQGWRFVQDVADPSPRHPHTLGSVGHHRDILGVMMRRWWVNSIVMLHS